MDDEPTASELIQSYWQLAGQAGELARRQEEAARQILRRIEKADPEFQCCRTKVFENVMTNWSLVADDPDAPAHALLAIEKLSDFCLEIPIELAVVIEEAVRNWRTARGRLTLDDAFGVQKSGKHLLRANDVWGRKINAAVRMGELIHYFKLEVGQAAVAVASITNYSASQLEKHWYVDKLRFTASALELPADPDGYIRRDLLAKYSEEQIFSIDKLRAAHASLVRTKTPRVT
jgi:hypothetical protein